MFGLLIIINIDRCKKIKKKLARPPKKWCWFFCQFSPMYHISSVWYWVVFRGPMQPSQPQECNNFSLRSTVTRWGSGYAVSSLAFWVGCYTENCILCWRKKQIYLRTFLKLVKAKREEFKGFQLIEWEAKSKNIWLVWGISTRADTLSGLSSSISFVISIEISDTIEENSININIV